MPALVDGGGGAPTSPGGVAAGGPNVADFGAGPVKIGALSFPWGPYHVNRVRQPNVYRQQGINAWLLNDYGELPRAYLLEGYATEKGAPYWPDPSQVAQINAQFPTGTTAVPLLVPYMGINTTVRLLRLTDDTDSTHGPGEVTFRLEVEECDGPLTVREGATA
jgi:hypothetical protein